MTELAYVLDSKPRFSGFDSQLGDYLNLKLTLVTFNPELWCNGNTSDFDSGILGSNPGSSITATGGIGRPARLRIWCREA